MSKFKRKQSNIISSLKRKNNRLIEELENYSVNNQISNEVLEEIKSFKRRVYPCANISLYRRNLEINITDYLASHTCKHKICFVCNFLRQKVVRRKYARWFKDNPEVVELRNKTGKRKYTTEKQFAEKYPHYTFVQRHKYDLMHLTLTVPHSAEGFKGKQYYFDTLKKCFHNLRNECKFWDDYVLGGEFGIEATSGSWLPKEAAERKNITWTGERKTRGGKTLVHRHYNDGLHIHLHALLFVKSDIRRSRNKLHREILLAWNRLTADEKQQREAFTPEMLAAIKKGNTLITDDDLKKLNAKGATFINLETIFTFDSAMGEKVRGGSELNSEAMKRAVMEVISYHFEPMAFDKESGEIDVPLMVEIIPKLRNVRLYEKFGCLQGEKSLNTSENGISLKEDFKEVVEMLIDENTGEIVYNNEYFICNPALVYHKPVPQDEIDKEIILSNLGKNTAYPLNAHTTSEAIGQMTRLVQQSFADMHKNKRK